MRPGSASVGGNDEPASRQPVVLHLRRERRRAVAHRGEERIRREVHHAVGGCRSPARTCRMRPLAAKMNCDRSGAAEGSGGSEPELAEGRANEVLRHRGRRGRGQVVRAAQGAVGGRHRVRAVERRPRHHESPAYEVSTGVASAESWRINCHVARTVAGSLGTSSPAWACRADATSPRRCGDRQRIRLNADLRQQRIALRHRRERNQRGNRHEPEAGRPTPGPETITAIRHDLGKLATAIRWDGGSALAQGVPTGCAFAARICAENARLRERPRRQNCA